MALVFFYPQLKKLTGAERLIVKLASYTARADPEAAPVLVTHRFAAECAPALDSSVRLVETGWRLDPTGNHYLDAALEYALGPALALRIPREELSGVVFFGPPSVPAMAVTRYLLLRTWGKRVPVLYFCFEPPRFIYSDTSDILRRIPLPNSLVRPLLTMYRWTDRRLVGSAHVIMANSPYGASKIRVAYGRRAPVIEHGVDFRPAGRAEALGIRERYGLGDSPVVITVNHLHPRKRIDLFLRSLAVARERVPAAVGLVVGDGPERRSLETLALEVGLELGKSVVFTGAVPEGELAAHYAAADVYVHTGREESFGLSVVEALASGVPVVTVNEGGPASTVLHGQTGLHTHADAESVGRAVARLLEDADGRAKKGYAAREYVPEHFSWERGAQKLLMIVDHVANKLK